MLGETHGGTKLTSTSSFQKAQSIAMILSAIAIPLVIALIGNSVQQSIAESGIKKDYLAIAISILKDGGEKADPEMKSWASAVVSAYSPVPFSVGAKEKLGAILSSTVPLPALPDSARQPDLPICNSGCSTYMANKIGSWAAAISQAGNENGAETLKQVLDDSVKTNNELAAALDRSRISGQACVAIYDDIRNAP